MKKIIAFCLVAGFAWASDCDDKIAKLKSELEFAKKHNNTFKMQGLEVAINELTSKCKDDSTYYTKALETKAQKQKALAELEANLKALESQKKTISKVEFKSKKAEFKAQKDKLKAELKALELY